jgi:hypothetical protein
VPSCIRAKASLIFSGRRAKKTNGSGGNGATEIVADDPEQTARAEPQQTGSQPATTGTSPAELSTRDEEVAAQSDTKPEQDTKTATLQTSDRCDVAACAAAYKSFRASDCTFQPYDGPRQLCEKSPASQSKQPAEPRQHEVARDERKPVNGRRDRDTELRAAVQVVKELTELPLTARRLVPVAERDSGPMRAACDIEACARAYNSFNPVDCQLCTR